MDTITVSKKYKPTRMCVCCRTRAFQNDLIRLQKQGALVSLFKGSGRSFYICKTCESSPILIKKLGSLLKIPKENLELFTINLKEIMFGQSSN